MQNISNNLTVKEVLALEMENLSDLLLESGVRIPSGIKNAKILHH